MGYVDNKMHGNSQIKAVNIYIVPIYISSQHSIHMLNGPVLQKQQQHNKTIQTSCANWAATCRFGVGKSFQRIIASRTYIWFWELDFF